MELLGKIFHGFLSAFLLHSSIRPSTVLNQTVPYLTGLSPVHPIFIGHRLFAKQENNIAAPNITLDIVYNIIKKYFRCFIPPSEVARTIYPWLCIIPCGATTPCHYHWPPLPPLFTLGCVVFLVPPHLATITGHHYHHYLPLAV